jgi:predicted dehydrogenase
MKQAVIVRVVVVGAGHLGMFHLAKLAAMPDVALIGVVDPHLARRHTAQSRFGIAGADTLQHFANRADAVVIAAPTALHVTLGLEALRLGFDVLVEKPIAETVSGAEALIAMARQQERILQVGHIERFNPAVAAALPYIRAPRYIVAERLGPFSGRSPDVDVVLDLMIHDLDIVSAVVCAPCVEVRAIGVSVMTNAVDMASARLTFADGTVAQLSAGRASLEPSRKLRFFTPEHYISIDCASRDIKAVRRQPAQQGNDWPSITGEPIAVEPGDALAMQDADFLECVIHRRKPRVDGLAALRALQLAACIKAAMQAPAPGACLPTDTYAHDVGHFGPTSELDSNALS